MAAAIYSLIVLAAPLGAEVPPERLGSGLVFSDRIIFHSVDSPHQRTETEILVLPPKNREARAKWPVVYLLPVEAGAGRRWGDPFRALASVEPAILDDLFVVYPTFSDLPWYADHPSDPGLRQEKHFLSVVLPFVEKRYPVDDAGDERYLVGFSKSGWGAWSLILRNESLFEFVVAWDAPMMVAKPDRYGMGPIFGSVDNFANYRIETLLRRAGTAFFDNSRPRLALLGFGSFRSEHVRVRFLLEDLGIEHVYRDGPERKHHWESGWLIEAFEQIHERINATLKSEED